MKSIYCRHCGCRIYMSLGGRWLDSQYSLSRCHDNNDGTGPHEPTLEAK